MKSFKIPAMVVSALTIVALLPGTASAAQETQVEGDVSKNPDQLYYSGDIFPTVSKTGNITINYTNVIGGSSPLYLRLCKPRTFECFADTRTLTKKGKYTLGTSVLKGTRFVIQYRAPKGVPNDNTHWEGYVTTP